MSAAEVEHPNLATHSSQYRLTTDGIELTGFRPAPRPTSFAAILNPSNDNSAAERYARSIRRGQSSSLSVDRGPSAPQQSVGGGHPVTVIEDTGPGGDHINIGGSNGAHNRPIVVLDSDEEQEEPSGSAHLRNRRGQSGVPRRDGRSGNSAYRIFSPPPPPPQHHPVPPVPPMPPLVAERLPFIILPPPVNNNQLRNRLPFDEPPQSISGNNSNGNGIQLGGGLFSQGNGSGHGHGPRAQVHFQPRRSEGLEELFNPFEDYPPIDRASNLFGRFFASYFSGGTFLSRNRASGQNTSRGRARMNAGGFPPRHVHHAHQDIDVFDWSGEGGGEEDVLRPSATFFGMAAFSGLGPWGRRDAMLGLGPDYDRRMTHPERAGPGWTYDFGSEQEEGKSNVDGSEILVCAKCLDPLLANADGMVDVSEEEKKGRRVWALRCGHVLDGKCVGALMRPGGETDLANKVIDPQGNNKGKKSGKVAGKQKQVNSEDADAIEVDGLVTSLDVKGKGKAPAAPICAPTPPPLHNKEKAPSPALPAGPAVHVPPEDTSIRSRLRPRHSLTLPSSSAATPSFLPRRSARHSATPYSLTRGGPSSTRRRGTKRKRAADVTSEVIEERYEWTCPVPGCARLHVSVKVGGLWKMDLEQGAVGLYV